MIEQVAVTFGSLFAGIGGFDLGMERSGWRCVWQVENDRWCNEVLARHWPDVPRFGDVRGFPDGAIDAVRPDLICGGFPCQDLSVAGKRAGLAGKRSSLFWEFVRVLHKLAPRWVLIENVPGLLSSNGGRDFGSVLRALGQLGYGFAYRVLDAQWFGVPQRRRRVFIVGCFGDWRRAAEVLFERESLPWDSPPSREAGTGTAQTVASGLGASGRGFARAGESRGQDCVVPFVFSPQASGKQTALGVSEMSPSLKTTTQVGLVNAMTVRGLTPRECERLQAFPDDWTRYAADGTELKDGPRYRMLGNAVSVNVTQWIGHRIEESTQRN